MGGGQHDGLQGGGVGQAWLALAEGGQEPGVGGGADLAQVPPVLRIEVLGTPKSEALLIVVSTRSALPSFR